MGKKSKFSIQEKERIILEFLNNKISSKYISKNYKVNKNVLNNWIHRYQANGISGLEDAKGSKIYEKEIDYGVVGIIPQASRRFFVTQHQICNLLTKSMVTH